MEANIETVPKRRYERERKLKKEAERLLEVKTTELYEAKNLLKNKVDDLEESRQALMATEEELRQTIEELQTAQEERELANIKLEKLNSGLEQIVHLRTEELREEKAKVMSSIRYAQRIQEAILPEEDEIKNHFNDIFIFNKPRDIVSGDFYWFCYKDPKPIYKTDIRSKTGEKQLVGFDNNKLIIAAIDCTGHGVPGAFISLIANDLLNQIVKYEGVTEANLILNHLRSEVNKELKQKKTGMKDGMDLAICVIDKEKKILEFSGAMNPLIYIKKNDQGKAEVVTIKGDKAHIGGVFNTPKRPYTKHTIDISEPTSFYIFSDGYQDQFGGEKDKKFMIKRFRELLLEIHYKPMEEQKEILNDTLVNWMQGRKQIDDILVVGFRI